MGGFMWIRRGQDRGHADHGWLKSYHTFSFADYYDPKYMHFSALRVINEDWIEPGRGFGTHPHRDMEILTYILEGALEHKDSMGTGSVIRPGDVQRMSAGTGVAHSEFNHSKEEHVHLLQIWILPDKIGLEPSYEEKPFPESEKLNQLRLIASREGERGSVKIHQNVKIYATILEEGNTLEYLPPKERFTWLQLARGAVTINGETLQAGDAAAFRESEVLKIEAKTRSEFITFDLTPY
jgi:redox-sensitive bicupin YhaK (pirin superfamily)